MEAIGRDSQMAVGEVTGSNRGVVLYCLFFKDLWMLWAPGMSQLKTVWRQRVALLACFQGWSHGRSMMSCPSTGIYVLISHKLSTPPCFLLSNLEQDDDKLQ